MMKQNPVIKLREVMGANHFLLIEKVENNSAITLIPFSSGMLIPNKQKQKAKNMKTILLSDNSQNNPVTVSTSQRVFNFARNVSNNQHPTANSHFRAKSHIVSLVLLLVLMQVMALGQPVSLFLQNTTTQTGTGGNIYDLSLAQGNSGTVTSGGNNSQTLTEELAFTRNISNLSSAISGNSFPVSLIVSGASSNNNFNARFRLQRINSSGAVQANTGYSAQFSSTGTYTATLSFTPAQTWVTTDRLRISIEVARNSSGSTARTITVRTGNASSYVQYTSCPTYSLTSTTAASPICTSDGTSLITLASSSAGLPAGSYTVTYSRSNPSASGLTAAMTVTTAGSGTFTATGLTIAGSATITITNLASGSCSNAISSGNISNSITINAAPAAPAAASATNATICAGGSSTLSATGGSGTTLVWYTSSCGGTSAGTGNNLSVSPSTTTTYYARYESSPCTPSGCVNVTVTVNPRPTSSISGTKTVCNGQSATISISLTGTAPWNLTYTDGSISTPVTNVTISPYTFSITPASPKSFSVTALSDTKCTAQSGDMTGSAVITINPNCQVVTLTQPDPIVTVPAGNIPICSGGTTNITLSSIPAGATFKWSAAVLPGGSAIGFSDGSGSIISQQLTNTGTTNAVVHYTIIGSNGT